MYRSSDGQDMGVWQATTPVKGLVTWSLTAAGASWIVKSPLVALQPGIEYSIYGRTTDYTARRLRGVHPRGSNRDASGPGAVVELDGLPVHRVLRRDERG